MFLISLSKILVGVPQFDFQALSHAMTSKLINVPDPKVTRITSAAASLLI